MTARAILKNKQKQRQEKKKGGGGAPAREKLVSAMRTVTLYAPISVKDKPDLQRTSFKPELNAPFLFSYASFFSFVFLRGSPGEREERKEGRLTYQPECVKRKRDERLGKKESLSRSRLEPTMKIPAFYILFLYSSTGVNPFVGATSTSHRGVAPQVFLIQSCCVQGM